MPEEIKSQKTEYKPTLQNVRYAGFSNRLYASIIDTTLLLLIMIPLFPGTSSMGTLPVELQQSMKDMNEGLILPSQFLTEFSRYLIESGIMAKMLTNWTLQFVIMAVACVMFWIYRDATPGKMLFRMKIVDAKTLGKASTAQMVTRYIGYIISTLPLFLGFIWIGIDKRKQGWHDKISRTVVIYTRPGDTKEEKDRKFKIQTFIILVVFLVLLTIYTIKKMQ